MLYWKRQTNELQGMTNSMEETKESRGINQETKEIQL